MGRVLNTRTAHGLAWAVGGLSVALATFSLTLIVLNWSTPLPVGMDAHGANLALLLAFLPFSLVGALILYRRPEHSGQEQRKHRVEHLRGGVLEEAHPRQHDHVSAEPGEESRATL